jgi:hypothetical protein
VPPREDNQGGLWDRTIESPEIEQAIEDMLAAQDAYRAYLKARKVVRTVVEEYALADGERLRCGAYVLSGKERGGGGFEVPVWKKVTLGGVQAL